MICDLVAIVVVDETTSGAVPEDLEAEAEEVRCGKGLGQRDASLETAKARVAWDPDREAQGDQKDQMGLGRSWVVEEALGMVAWVPVLGLQLAEERAEQVRGCLLVVRMD